MQLRVRAIARGWPWRSRCTSIRKMIRKGCGQCRPYKKVALGLQADLLFELDVDFLPNFRLQLVNCQQFHSGYVNVNMKQYLESGRLTVIGGVDEQARLL